MLTAIRDWDDAYANGANIPGGERWPALWVAPARKFRDALGARAELDVAYFDHPRAAYDLFRPDGPARGLVVFVHGGYWVRLDRSYWSHLAAGPLAHGWAVAVPSYPLAPEARIADIARHVGRAAAHAGARVDGPIRLAGHSAGGHLVTRLSCDDADDLLGADVAARLARIVSISGLHDLRPLLRTAMNADLRLDADEARAESPALRAPREGTELVAWVGQAERAEFLRQSALLANVWRGLGARTELVAEADRHHFDVIDGLADPESDLTLTLLGERR